MLLRYLDICGAVCSYDTSQNFLIKTEVKRLIANMSLSPASGIGRFYKHSAKIIRFVRLGCTNRPFYHIVVMERRKNQHQPVIEQLGSYDPLTNQFNERLVSLNFERIRYWLGKGAHMSTPAAEMLGLSGLLPIHPRTYMTAWRNRQTALTPESPAAS